MFRHRFTILGNDFIADLSFLLVPNYMNTKLLDSQKEFKNVNIKRRFEGKISRVKEYFQK